jgi:predicted RNase H-like HicB family nuclease
MLLLENKDFSEFIALLNSKGVKSFDESERLWEHDGMDLAELKLKLTAVFEPASEGGYTSHFEELPEVFSEGETLEEAKTNLLDALTEVMEYHREEARICRKT